MGEHSRRYMFIIYAIYAGGILSLAYYPIKWITKTPKARYLIAVLAMAICMTKVVYDRTDAFFFRYDTEGMQMSEIEDDANIILSLDTAFILVCATDKLMDKGHFFVTNSRALVNHRDCPYIVPEIELEKKPLYVGIELTGLRFDGLNEVDEEVKIDKIGEAYSKVEEDVEDTRTKLYDVKKELLTVIGADDLEYKGIDRLFGRRIAIYKVEF